MAENRYGLAGQGMGKVKSINPYRLTPGFGGFTPVSHVPQRAAFHAANAASVQYKQHFVYFQKYE
ncbi:TPA: hypothetical protein ACGPH2_003508 [Escherichia coli]